ncbi:hypothetical protein EDB85DRAFT_1903482 [Lactarius pseudohatsudake]|nr:hypothetical protein EDB85DRAFT_1903482 [Lactarius pseudohatsudake]
MTTRELPGMSSLSKTEPNKKSRTGWRRRKKTPSGGAWVLPVSQVPQYFPHCSTQSVPWECLRKWISPQEVPGALSGFTLVLGAWHLQPCDHTTPGKTWQEFPKKKKKEDAQQALCDKEDKLQRKEAEKKRPKIGSFVKGQGVGNWIEPRPAQYALNKINNLEYIKLDYFTIRGCRDTAADSNKSISQDTMTFAQFKDTLAIRPLTAMRPS